MRYVWFNIIHNIKSCFTSSLLRFLFFRVSMSENVRSRKYVPPTGRN